MNENFLSNLLVFWNRFLDIFRKETKIETNRSEFSNVNIKSCKRLSIDNCPLQSKKFKNPNSINIPILPMNQIDINNFTNKIKTYFQCSKCKISEKCFKQCFNGHLFCEKCIGNIGVFCDDCNTLISENDLSICTLPSNIYSHMKSICNYCHSQYYEDFLSIHINEFCTKRNTNCDFYIFGCLWIGTADKKQTHVKHCQFQQLKIKQAIILYQNYINKQKKLLEIENSLFKECLLKVNQQNNGLRIVIKELILKKFQIGSVNKTIQFIKFKSPMINLPFSCCVNHGFCVEFIIVVDSERNTKKFRYVIKSESNVKAKLFFCLIDFKLNSIEEENKVIDQFHWHEFQPGNEESNCNEVKINFTTNDICLDRIINIKHIKLTVCVLGNDLNLEKSNLCQIETDQTEMENFISLFMSSMISLNENIDIPNNSQTPIPAMINSSSYRSLN